MDITEQIHKNAIQLPPEKQIEVLDFIVFLLQRMEPASQPVGEAIMMDRMQSIRHALESLAEMQTFSDIVDPVAWQRDLRQDRPLPGREP